MHAVGVTEPATSTDSKVWKSSFRKAKNNGYAKKMYLSIWSGFGEFLMGDMSFENTD
jgi:hypothetical protein